MDKPGDCDSDGSLSWEDFFGSSTDLVPSLLTMYDTLISQRLSKGGGGGIEASASSQNGIIKNSAVKSEMVNKVINNKNELEIKNVRPMSLASSSSSSSSTSSMCEDGGGGGGLAPRASPEEIEGLVDLSSIPGVGCLSNSAQKDCGENAVNLNSARGRISYPIQVQGKPKFYDPNLSYMDRVVMEIVETERIYVNDLEEIISGYLEHWRSQPEESLNPNHINELFSNIEEIHKFNSEFLEQLEVCGLNPVGVARCFVTKNEGFSVYTQYCTHYPRTMFILTEMMREEVQGKSFRERQAALGHSLPLGSYLLKPVQRILKYHLLLQNIVKHYEDGREGFSSIVDALSAMTNIAHHINEMKRRHEDAVRVQEIQSLLYGWQGEDLTRYGELCAEGTFRAYGAKAIRHVFLFDKIVLITKKKEDGVLHYKSHIMCSNLMLIESVPGEPMSFHVIPFDNPRLQCTLQGRTLEQKREWTLQLKRVILENYHAVIPLHARQLVMQLGQSRPQEGGCEKVVSKRQHSAPEYLERRKLEKDRRKSESSLKGRLRRARKTETISKECGNKSGRGRSQKNSWDSSGDSNKGERSEVSIDRKCSSASCPPTGSDKPLVKKLSGWRRKSEPGIYAGNSDKHNPHCQHINEGSLLTLDSTSSIGEEEAESFLNVFDESLEEEGQCPPLPLHPHPHQEERRESIEEIVGQLVMQNREFQRILSKQRSVHLRKNLGGNSNSNLKINQNPRQREAEESDASETETEEISPVRKSGMSVETEDSSSSKGIGGSSSSMMSSEALSEEVDELSASTKNVQRTVSDPGNKATLTPRRFMQGQFTQYDPLSLLWSSFRSNTRRKTPLNSNSNSPALNNSNSKAKLRHTHSFTCSRKEAEAKLAASKLASEGVNELPHGDSGVNLGSFTSDSSTSSSEANIPTLPSVWLKQQEEHLAKGNNKSGSLPRSFQPGITNSKDSNNSNLPPTLLPGENPLGRFRDGKFPDRPVTIASDKPSASDMNYEEMEHYMNKFNDEMNGSQREADLEVDDLPTPELTPIMSMDNLSSLHPDYKIYRASNKSSIKQMLLSVTARLSGLNLTNLNKSNSKTNASNSAPNSNSNKNASPSNKGSSKENFLQSSYSNLSCNENESKNFYKNKALKRKTLKQKLRNIVKEDNPNNQYRADPLNQRAGDRGRERAGDSDSENYSESGFGGSSVASFESGSGKIGARLASQSNEMSDFTLSKLWLGGGAQGHQRPHSVMSISSTLTSSSSTDEKMSSGLGESLSGSSNQLDCPPNLHIYSTIENAGACAEASLLSNPTPSLYLRGNKRKGVNHRDLYLSYIDQEDAGADADSDASADSFYERSFEAIESLLENELFPGESSGIYSGEEDASEDISNADFKLKESPISVARRHFFSNASINAAVNFNSISILAARLSNSIPSSNASNSNSNDSRRSSRLIRSQAILEKLKHLEECSQFNREDLPSPPSFEGIKSIQERRKELELWKAGRDENYETSSQHSTSTINTVIELVSPGGSFKSGSNSNQTQSFPSSRRCSDTENGESSGESSPMTERAISRNSCGNLNLGERSLTSSGDEIIRQRSKGWVKLVVGKLQGAETAIENNSSEA